MNKNLVIITGITMAGKSSTAKALVKRLQTEGVVVELLKETTTRPKRESDYINPEYNFVTEEEYAKRKFLTSVDFNVASGEVWRYGIENQDFPKLGIIVSNMYAVDALFSRRISPTNVNITVIYLNVTEKEILKRDKGDRLSQAGDDVMLRVKRDIDKNNQIFEKWEDCIHEIWCDDLSFEEVLDCVYYAIKEDECF